ncbi:MAG: tetratricopeptide repeat protein [Chloroflexi bacterium]|nr:tetratricopeptide repeat protein [Chloroflexota bacterium]MCY4248294.1 tetratricopeptide repeat protein [Chloroflexota bacterium]
MSTMPAAEKIGQAWRMHRDNDNNRAIQMFNDILATHPESVDALYGLGLAYKTNGEAAEAARAFEQALSIAKSALSAVRQTSQAEGHHSGNDLETNVDDRYMMLSRMLKQRIETVAQS